MPPTFRSSRSGRQFGDGVNRTRTGQIDHDLFEGLPVRRWTRQVQTVSQEPKTEGSESEVPGQPGNQFMPDHPMPRDSHLLSPMSRALLRAARAGCIYIRQASNDFEDEDKEATDPEEQQTTTQNTERNFAMRKWTTVPKHMEVPEVEFLAKRRPGLPSLYGATAGTVEGAIGSVPMRKTRFKKVDPMTGNILIYAAWVPEGHKIEGEVAHDAQLIPENSQVTVTPQAPAPGTVIEGVGVVNAQGVVVAEAGSAAVLTPPRRRPPPPKRKAKGLKGRRKKVMFAPGDGADASLVHGAGVGAGNNATNYGKETDSSRMSVDQTTQDDEDDDGEEGEESDEGDGDESGFDAKTPETPGPQPSTEPEPEPTPGETVSSTPQEVMTNIRTEPQAPQVPEPSFAAESLEASARSVVPPTPEKSQPAATDIESSGPINSPSEVTAAAPAIKEDIQMTDAVPTDPLCSPPVRVSDIQEQASPEVAQPAIIEKAPSLPQKTQQSPTPEPTHVAAETTQEPAREQPAEPMDITMAESNVPASEPTQVEPADIEILTEAPQLPLQASPSEGESVSQQTNQQPSGSGFDLLDNLEASLDNIPKETSSDEQKETKLDQSPEVSVTQETAPESEPEVPVHWQPSTQAPVATNPDLTTEAIEPTPTESASPVQQALAPEIELAPARQAEAAIEQPVPPPTEPQELEKGAEVTTHFEAPPSTEPAAEHPQTTTEQPKEKPDNPSQGSVSEQSPSESSAPFQPIAKPPAAEEVPVHFSSSGPEAERQLETATESKATGGQKRELKAEPETAATAEPTAEPPVAQDPSQDVPFSFSYVEPEAKRSAEENRAREQETASNGPSSNGEPQNQ
ncbi:hypothetical protein BDW59DRAFT_140681 [Aspergillus cavernicola]|uniref:LYR family protein n=1 Tax=Aspergillus cavernicola TaxID=176166 RepID=A0ABR4ITX3_9EURO